MDGTAIQSGDGGEGAGGSKGRILTVLHGKRWCPMAVLMAGVLQGPD